MADGQDAGEMLLDIEARIGELVGPPKSPVRMSGKFVGREKSNHGINPRLASHLRPSSVSVETCSLRDSVLLVIGGRDIFL